jgi:GxxExxY protein
MALDHDSGLANKIIGHAINVHREMGPGLLEVIYEECLCEELAREKTLYARQVPIPLTYKGVRLECAFRADIIVESKVLIELKSVERLAPVHEAQILTYLRLSNLRVGLLMNFGSALLKDGLKRFVR